LGCCSVLSRVEIAARDYSRIQNVTLADSMGVRLGDLWARAGASWREREREPGEVQAASLTASRLGRVDPQFVDPVHPSFIPASRPGIPPRHRAPWRPPFSKSKFYAQRPQSAASIAHRPPDHTRRPHATAGVRRQSGPRCAATVCGAAAALLFVVAVPPQACELLPSCLSSVVLMVTCIPYSTRDLFSSPLSSRTPAIFLHPLRNRSNE
jgi:hypothetical protein